MPELKLAKLPDRAPVKITITVTPDLKNALQVYTELYREAYGQSETVAELIPFMLQTFLDGDRGFVRAAKKRERTASLSVTPKVRLQSTDQSGTDPTGYS